MDGGVQVLARTQRGDDDRHLPFGAGLQVDLQPVVGAVDDLIDRKGCCRALRMVAIVRGKLLGDPVQPLVEQRRGTGIERGKRADDPRLALRDHQLRPRNDEQRRTDDRQAQAVEQRGKAHGAGCARWRPPCPASRPRRAIPAIRSASDLPHRHAPAGRNGPPKGEVASAPPRSGRAPPWRDCRRSGCRARTSCLR